MANIERVVRVAISLRTASVRQQTFSDLMLFGAHSGPRVTIITDADDLLDPLYGLDETSGLYKAAQVGFSQIPGPDRLFVGRRDLTESATDALVAIGAEGQDWYALTDVSHNPDEAEEIAQWCESHEKLFLTAFSEIGAGSVPSTLSVGKYYRSAGWYVPPDTNAWTEVATAARCFQVLPGGETWANKELTAVPAIPLSETLAQQIFNLNGNTFEPIRNLAVTQNGKVFGGEYIDVIRFRDWLTEEIKVRVFREFVVHDKIPYTDAGIEIIVNAMRGALALGQRRGGIAPDTYDEQTRRLRPGFTTSAPLAYQVSANDKANRILRDVKFSALLAGAIHAVEITGDLVLENPNFG